MGLEDWRGRFEIANIGMASLALFIINIPVFGLVTHMPICRAMDWGSMSKAAICFQRGGLVVGNRNFLLALVLPFCSLSIFLMRVCPPHWNR